MRYVKSLYSLLSASALHRWPSRFLECGNRPTPPEYAIPCPTLLIRSFRLVFSILLCLALLTIPIPGLAEVGTNPASGNPLDYGGAGDWYGSADPDQLTNESGATVNGDIYANHNSAGGSSGGENAIINHGTLNGTAYGSYNSGDEPQPLRQLQLWLQRRLQHHHQLRHGGR